MNSLWLLAAVPGWVFALFGIAMFVTAIFIIMLVLVQRGRGGGLAGAFGGAGGQSAFGAKAGDTFTKVTIYASTFWILLCMAALAVLNPRPDASDVAPAGINNPAGAPAPGDSALTNGAAGDGVAGDGVAEDGAADSDAEDAANDSTETSGADGTSSND